MVNKKKPVLVPDWCPACRREMKLVPSIDPVKRRQYPRVKTYACEGACMEHYVEED